MSDDPNVDVNADPPPEGNDTPPAADPAPPSMPSYEDFLTATVTDEEIRDFVKRSPSLEDLGRMALGFRKKLSTAITIPGDGATDDDWADFRKKMGVPDTAEGYELSVTPEDDVAKGLVGAVVSAMHKSGAPQPVVNAAVSAGMEFLTALGEHKSKTIEEAHTKADVDFTRRHGPAAESVKAHALAAMEHFSSENLNALLETAEIDGVKIGNHPAIIDTFAAIGRQLMEAGDQLPEGSDRHRDAQSRHAELTAEIANAREKGDWTLMERLEDQRTAISEQLYGLEQVTSSR